MRRHLDTVHQTFALSLIALGLLGACAHNQNLLDPKKSAPSAAVPSPDQMSAQQNLSPEMKRKFAEAEQLKKNQTEIYELQDLVYGNTEYGSVGLYGALRECKTSLADKKNGGTGALNWDEPIDRVADRETRLQGLDDTKQLELVPEQLLLDRQKRFQGYREVLTKRQDELEDRLEICRGELKARRDSEVEPPHDGIKHERDADTQEPL